MAITELPTFGLGDRLRKARKLARLSQDQMAEKMGVSRPTISSWETGKTQPKVSQAERWGEETHAPFEWFANARSESVYGASSLFLDDGQPAFDFGEHQLSSVA